MEDFLDGRKPFILPPFLFLLCTYHYRKLLSNMVFIWFWCFTAHSKSSHLRSDGDSPSKGWKNVIPSDPSLEWKMIDDFPFFDTSPTLITVKDRPCFFFVFFWAILHLWFETCPCRLIWLFSLFPLFAYMAAIVLSISKCALFLFTTDPC